MLRNIHIAFFLLSPVFSSQLFWYNTLSYGRTSNLAISYSKNVSHIFESAKVVIFQNDGYW